MAKILIGFDTSVDVGLEKLAQFGELIRPPKGHNFTYDELLEQIEDVDILCSIFYMPITAELMDRAKKLKLIANYAVGYNNIDIDAAKERGIVVTNTPQSVIKSTAELAFALMISATRRIVFLDNMIRKGKGNYKFSITDHLGVDLGGKTLGILGYGNIGEALAKRANAFDMKVLYYKRSRLDEAKEKELGIEYASFDDILAKSDILSLHTPYSKATHHLINAETIAKMKDKAILINTARGSVVDEKALISALKSSKISMAAMDVFENKDIPSPELLEMDNVVMTPHVGTQTHEGRQDMANELIANVMGFLEGRDDIARVV